MKTNRNFSGFTLIEVLIVVALIGILAAISLPVYQDYVKRTKLTEVLLAASTCRTAVTEVVQTAGVLPAAGAWGCESATPTSKYVAAVETDAFGAIHVLVSGIGDKNIDGHYVSLVPLATGDVPPVAGDTIFRWVCGNQAVLGTSTFVTDIPAKFLPGSCRG
jgi:type IV pilus assembly protein PilA